MLVGYELANVANPLCYPEYQSFLLLTQTLTVTLTQTQTL